MERGKGGVRSVSERAGGAEEGDGVIVRVRKRNRREKWKAASGALLSAAEIRKGAERAVAVLG